MAHPSGTTVRVLLLLSLTLTHPLAPVERPYDPRPYDSRYSRDYDRRGGGGRYDDYRGGGRDRDYDRGGYRDYDRGDRDRDRGDRYGARDREYERRDYGRY